MKSVILTLNLIFFLCVYLHGQFTDAHLSMGITVDHDGDDYPEIMGVGSGGAWFDIENDGDLDLYITMRTSANKLFINDGFGRFTEMAAQYGIQDINGDGAGVAAGDFNNDGFKDLFLANGDEDRLYKNLGGTGFIDITNAAGFDMSDDSRGTSASWGDYDGDGYLDLYVSNHNPTPSSSNYASRQDHLFKNNGDETFTDVSFLLSETGNLDGYGFIGGWSDYDLDGDLDIILINDCFPSSDSIYNQVFRNDGNTHPTLSWNFTEVGQSLGFADCAHGMGLAVGDYNRDGRFDYYFSNIGPAKLYQNEIDTLIDVSAIAQVDGQVNPLYSWGTSFLDYDLDGWQDLFLTLGSLHYPSAEDAYDHSNMLFRNNGNGIDFTDVSVPMHMHDSTRSRNGIFGDYDNDGDLDILLINYGEDVALKRNDHGNGYHFLKVDLRGTISNADGIGAKIRIVTPDGNAQWFETRSGSNLGGGDQPGAHFGLGSNTKVDTLEVFWPSGQYQYLTNIAADQRLDITEPQNQQSGIAFVEVAAAKGITEGGGLLPLGGGVSFADFNQDGWDDLTFATGAGDSISFYVNDQGTFTKIPGLIQLSDTLQNEAIIWVDYDNDGDKDLLVTNFEGPNRLFRNNGNLNLTDVTESAGLPVINDPSYGAIFGDYNNDGYLDLYIANWSFPPVYQNFMFLNNGDGTFTDMTATTGTGDGYNLTFCSAFLDYDRDGWPDLYNAQDRITSINSMFKNNGNGTFSDVSAATNTDIAIDAMNVGVGDYDNDYDLDIYITNTVNPAHDIIGNAFLRNNGDGTFTEVASETGTAFMKVGWGGNFVDVDLDMDLDLYVSGMANGIDKASALFVNAFPIDTFYSYLIPGDTLNSFSNAIGDFNNDGWPDIVVNNANFGAVENPHHLWQNNSSEPHFWLKVDLEGTESNREGVGSWIELWVNGQAYVRYKHCGIGYLAQNSDTEFFGLGTNQMADSLIVRWPSGNVSKMCNVTGNQRIKISESRIIYVAADATGDHTGYNWQNAFTSLHDALDYAECSLTREIWIKAGTYIPHPANRHIRFRIPEGVKIYGGFNGTENSLAERDPLANPVILSGEINSSSTEDNAYRVIEMTAEGMPALLDGVIIRGGMANGQTVDTRRGAGLLCTGNLTLMNVVIQDCQAVEHGAGIYCNGTGNTLEMINLTCQNNFSSNGKIIFSNDNTQLRFSGNNAVQH